MNKPLEWVDAGSSNLSEFAYERNLQRLWVRFHSSSKHTYVYNAVPLTTYNGLKRASSRGTYFSNNIKHVFSFKKVIG